MERSVEGCCEPKHSSHILHMDTFQLLSGWLKEVAPENIFHIAVTLDTSHLLSGWLKEVALSNIHRFFLIFFSND